MTPRHEIFKKCIEALQQIKELELIALDRNQFNQGDNSTGCYTAVLIKSPSIEYQTMTERVKEGHALLEFTLYVKDGWLNQHHTTEDPNYGFLEINLIDSVTEVLEGLNGNSFSGLKLTSEEQDDISENDLMSYRLVFSTEIYKQINYSYKPKKIKVN